jgi:cyclophilin family peptidyl-prolyl cis-trans isomerase
MFRIFTVWITFIVLTSWAQAVNAPTNATIEWRADGKVYASWVDNSTDEGGFIIGFRRGTSGQFQIFDDVGPNVTTYVGNVPVWSGCALYNLAVFSIRYDIGGVNIIDQAISNVISVTAPPFNPYGASDGQNFRAATLNTTFTWTPAGTCLAGLIWSSANLPSWLTLDTATGVLSGTPTTEGTFTFVVTFGTATATQSATLKVTVFIPVPASANPTITSPLGARTQLLGVASPAISLNTHFNDPDVTVASRIVTNMGAMNVIYFPSAAPQNVANFQSYISRGDLVDTIIHRSIPGFVIQGGGYRAAAGTPSITRQAPVTNEPKITNARGTLSMAKSAGNPNSATSEFFVNLADNAGNLNQQNEGFTVFARLNAEGMATADAIAALTRKNFSATNGVLTDLPCLNPPPTVFDLASLVKVISAGPVAPLSYSVSVLNPAVCSAAIVVDSLTVTGLALGSTTIAVTATDLDGASIQQVVPVTIREDYQTWKAQQSFASAEEAFIQISRSSHLDSTRSSPSRLWFS